MGGYGVVDPIELVVPDPSYDMYLDIARTIGDRQGTCTRRNVGAVLVADGRLREIGWNGMERNFEFGTCQAGWCPRGKLSLREQPHGVGYSNCIYRHAEINVAENFRHSQRARNVEGWASALGVTIYSSSVPCEDCVKYAARAGIVLIWTGGLRGNGPKASTQ